MKLQMVRATPNVKQKFVLVRVSNAGEQSLILWGNPNIQWHKDIVEEIAKSGYEITETLGGGWMLPKPEEKIVYIWGKSDRLGVAPINLVREVLKDKIVEKEPK
jgi:hypothetical protein